jgi:hypothetical protein
MRGWIGSYRILIKRIKNPSQKIMEGIIKSSKGFTYLTPRQVYSSY